MEKAEDFGVLRRNDSRISADSREFEMIEEPLSPFELNIDLTRMGLEAIVQVRTEITEIAILGRSIAHTTL